MKPTTMTPAQIISASSAAFFVLAACGQAKPALSTAAVYQATASRPSLIAPKDYQRLVSFQQKINQTQQVSDADVTFLVKEFSSFPPQNTSLNNLTAANFVLDHTYTYGPTHKRLTPSLRRRLYDAIVPYTRTPDSPTEVNASLALASTRDPRATGRLQNLVWSSPYPTVRLSAKVFLAQLRKVLASPPK